MECRRWRRNGTRVRAQIPVRLTSLDPVLAFSESCHTILVNPQGCGVRFPRRLKPGLRVRIDAPCGSSVLAHVAGSTALGRDGRHWLVGIGFERPGNPWSIAPAPQDWQSCGLS